MDGFSDSLAIQMYLSYFTLIITDSDALIHRDPNINVDLLS